jgi:hypothetical protein
VVPCTESRAHSDCCSCLAIEDVWTDIWQCIDRTVNERGADNPVFINYQAQRWKSRGDIIQVWQYLVPRLLLWDPLDQYQLIVRDSIRCPEHGVTLTTGSLRSTNNLPPRWLYDIDGATLLIMRNYECRGRAATHSFLSEEAIITDQLPSCIPLPFRLSHRAGYTVRLQDLVIRRYGIKEYC